MASSWTTEQVSTALRGLTDYSTSLCEHAPVFVAEVMRHARWCGIVLPDAQGAETPVSAAGTAHLSSAAEIYERRRTAVAQAQTRTGGRHG